MNAFVYKVFGMSRNNVTQDNDGLNILEKLWYGHLIEIVKEQ